MGPATIYRAVENSSGYSNIFALSSKHRFIVMRAESTLCNNLQPWEHIMNKKQRAMRISNIYKTKCQVEVRDTRSNSIG